MFKYFFTFSYTVGRYESAHNVYFNRFQTFDHEITEEDIKTFKDQVGKQINQPFCEIKFFTQISSQ